MPRVNFQSPCEIVYGHKPDISSIRRFGCEAFVLYNDAKSRPKFTPRARKTFLLECNSTGYTLVQALTKTIIRSKMLILLNQGYLVTIFGPETYLPTHEESHVELSLGEQDSGNCSDQREQMGSTLEPVAPPTTSELVSEEPPLQIVEGSPSKEPGSSMEFLCENDDAKFFIDKESNALLTLMCLKAVEGNQNDPTSCVEAMLSDERENWQEAINDWFNALYSNETWETVLRNNLPKGTEVIKARWVHRKKFEADGKIRYRNRPVAKGFADTNQYPYYDRTEIYSPEARLVNVRFLFTVANKFDLDIEQFDIRTAFPNGTIEKPVFMEIPMGSTDYLQVNDSYKTTHVVELKRALCGLKGDGF